MQHRALRLLRSSETATRVRREGKWRSCPHARQVVLLMNYRYYLPVCARENHRKSRTRCDGKMVPFGKDRRIVRSRNIPTKKSGKILRERLIQYLENSPSFKYIISQRGSRISRRREKRELFIILLLEEKRRRNYIKLCKCEKIKRLSLSFNNLELFS